MNFTILDYFEKSVSAHPNNIAVSDENVSLSYKELYTSAKSAASEIARYKITRRPMAILMKRSTELTCAMLSVLYSGNFYVVLDCDSPTERLSKIIETLSPALIIYEEEFKETAFSLCKDNVIKTEFSSAANHTIDENALLKIRAQMLTSDAAYSIFTSGSTGVPKGAVLTHANVISYMEWFVPCFDITDENIFGSQTPLYFSMSVTDFFASLFCAAQYVIIPKQYFAFPAKLVSYMNEKQVNTIYWVPSALGIAAKFDLFKYCKPEFLKTVLFAGEVMPIKYLNYWKKYFPELIYANLFGPTETTDICSYYKVDRSFSDDENLPIGVPCDNCRLFLVDENGNDVTDSSKGELYCAGPFVAAGYYNNPEKTAENFVQNPLQKNYPEIVYKTGDLAAKDENGNFIYYGRKDFQIKHMGYRIEPGEIETAFAAIDNINLCVCIYDKENDMLILAYEGSENLKTVLQKTAKSKLPAYMQPEKYFAFTSFPINQNGKTDRKMIAKIINEQ